MTERYDEATKKFMEDVSGEPQGETQDRTQARQALGALRAIVTTPNPKKALANLAVRQGISALAQRSFEKNSSAEEGLIDVIDVFDRLNAKYGDAWWDWEPETVIQTLDYDFGIEMGEDGKNVIGALQVVLNTNQAHENWHVFENVGHAFSSNEVHFGVVTPLDLDEVALAYHIINKLRPGEKYDSEIHRYSACVAKLNGVVYLPIEFFPQEVQEALDDIGNDTHFAATVESLWKSGKDGETLAEQIQIGRLREIKEYLEQSVGNEGS